MDIRCPKCGEPWEIGSLHEEVTERFGRRGPGAGPVSRPSYTVRVTRPDGSRTYKGVRLGRARAAREAGAWVHLHEGYNAVVVSEQDPAVRADIAAWRRAVTKGRADRYFPEEVN